MNQDFYSTIRQILESARQKVYATANTAMVHAYWLIGERIVAEQGGNEKSEYGSGLLQELSRRMTQDYGKGFTVANLKNMRQFYLTYRNGYAPRSELTWTHYRLLMRVQDDAARAFYLDECVKARWSSRQLERQINSFYFQRLLACREKDAVRNEIVKLESAPDPKSLIKDPYVLEFIGIPQSSTLYEKDLEVALISQLQNFLLELGRGFSFVARQKHLDLDGEHFYIDLVFYNYLLKCFVLIDLKAGKLTHQDIGQMDTYVRLFDDLERGSDDNPTIGIVLCTQKNEAVAKYSVLNDGKNIFASKYQLTLPTAEELQKYLEDERRKFEERQDIS